MVKMSINSARTRVAIIILMLCLLCSGSGKGADDSQVRIWLKIFQKRDRISMENSQGILVNDLTEPLLSLEICVRHGVLELGGGAVDTVHVRPAGGGYTGITTEYGTKLYSGSFSVTLRDGQLHVINTTSFQDYLAGVVGSEMGDAFSLEALKAQAVCSRSFFLAMREKDADYDACDVAGRFQAFRGMQHAGTKTRDAVAATAGQVLRGPDESFIPWFHSTCGGMLLTPGEAWRGDKVDIPAAAMRFDGDAEKPYCGISPYYAWSARLEERDIFRALTKQTGHDIRRMEFVFDNHGLCRQVVLSTAGNRNERMEGFAFKACLEREGIAQIRSVRFSAVKKGTVWHFEGKGFGHLVGLCQWGAEALARQGKGYGEILHYYFPGTRIEAAP